MLQEGLPKPEPEALVQELKKALYSNENTKLKFFPPAIEERYRQNFTLFDRNLDDHLDLKQTKELLTSVGIVMPDEEIFELYNVLALKGPENQHEETGINFDDFLLIVFKRKRIEDMEQQLMDAFKLFESQQSEKEGEIDCEIFKEALMAMGNRMAEEQADELLKDADPKGEGNFKYEDFIRKILKR